MSRYFDDTTVKTTSCRRCGEVGHTVSQCKKDTLELSKCLLCAETGHLVSNCPQRSHHRQAIRSYVNQDHSEDGAICIVCGDADHVNCTFMVDEEKMPIKSCAKCGGTGHMEAECGGRRTNNSSATSQPRISSGSYGSSRQSHHSDRNRPFVEWGQHSNRARGRHSYGGGEKSAPSSSSRGGGRWNDWEEDRFFNGNAKKRHSYGGGDHHSQKRQRIW